MLKSRLLWLFSVLLLSAAYVHADGIDPVIQVDDPQCTGTQTVTPGQIFTFNADSSGGGCNGFVAARQESDGPLITSLDIEAIAPNITDATTQVTCLSNAFAFCQARLLNGVLDIFLARCESEFCSTGINSGQAFSINLSDLALDQAGNRIPDPNDPGAFETVAGGGWIADQLFSAIADPSGGQPTTPFITAPEPSCVFLLFTGAAALAARRRIMKG
jgi:hypothetical protein